MGRNAKPLPMPLTNLAAATQILANGLRALESLREQSKSSNDSTLKENISKLYDTMLDLKSAVLRVEEDNAELRAKIRELENPAMGNPCPKCRKPGWQLESSRPDPEFGHLGAKRMSYKCSFCGFTDSEMVTAKRG
jgi:hypothetical protein